MDHHGLMHYNDVIISVMASQITSLAIVYPTPPPPPHKGPVTRKMFPFDDVITGEEKYSNMQSKLSYE